MSEARKATQQVIKNSMYLLMMQAANYALPLLTFPYLVLTVGSSVYGQVLLANSIIAFLITFADFGLNITATEQVSLNRNQPAVMQLSINHTVTLRLAAVVLMGLLWILALMLVPKLAADPLMFGATFLMVPAQVLNPTFFFQGQDRMGTYARLVIFSKVLYSVLVVVLVRDQESYWLINPLNGLSTLLANGLGWWLVFRRQGEAWNLRLQWPAMSFTKQSWYIMLGQLGQNALGSTYTIIAGFYLPAITYGKFALADKLIWPFHQLVGAGFQATFPQVTKLMDSSRHAADVFITKLKWVFGAVGAGGVVATLVCAPYIITFLNKGTPDQEATDYLRLLSPLIFMAAFRVPYQQLLFAGNRKPQYTKTILVANVLSLIMNLTAVYVWGVEGVIAAAVLIECFILASYWHFSRSIPMGDSPIS